MFPIILRREVVILLAVKTVLLTLLYVLFFSPAHRTEASPESLRAHIIGR